MVEPAQPGAGALQRRSWIAFGLGAAAIVVASRAAVASASFRAHPGALGAAVTADLTLSAAGLFWLTMCSARRVRLRELLGIVALGLLVARLLVPAEGRALPVAVGRALLASLELWLLAGIGWAALRLRRAARAGDLEEPLEEVVRRAAERIAGRHRPLEAAVTEASVLAMALCSWRSRPHVPRGAVPFTVHLRAGLGAALFALVMAGAGETIAVHVLLAHWSTRLAWAATAFSGYAFLWLVGDWRAMALRPILLQGDALLVRVGLRWRARVPLEAVTQIGVTLAAAERARCAVASPLGGPNLYLHLAAPIALEGVMGLRRRGDVLGLRVDDPAALRAAIVARLSMPRTGGGTSST